MSRFELRVDWLDPPPPEEAFGPERTTWGKLRIDLDGDPLTLNHPADRRGEDLPWVVGGMSGLAEWIVDAWLAIHLEIHTPFPKIPSFRLHQRVPRLPSLRDAMRGWPDFVSEDESISGDLLGAWQQRHTFGEAQSDIAIPSIVLVPEGTWMAIGLDHVPAALSPTVRFTPPGTVDAWPAPPSWVPMDDVSATLAQFVDATIHQARADAVGAKWSEWIGERWARVRDAAKSAEEIRRWKYGDLVARRWGELEKELDGALGPLAGVLTDVVPVTDEETLDWLAALVGTTPCAPTERIHRDFVRVDWGLPPYREGYRLAQEVRRRLVLGSEPLETADLERVLGRFGVRLQPTASRGLFRSAVWTRGEGAELVYGRDDARFHGKPPERFAIAAAFGRFLCDFEEGEAGGAAHSEQARWRPTQLASAFAAELLLPIQAIRKGFESVTDLAKGYGISRTAAEWHIENRADALEK